MTKTPRMFNPEYADIYFFKFPSGTVELEFLSKGEDGALLFFNKTLSQQAQPMNFKRFTYLLRFNLVDFCASRKKVNGLYHYKNETRYTQKQFDKLIDDINEIKF